MFFSSFFKKNVADNAEQSTVTATSSKSKKINPTVDSKGINLPSWKDTSMWSTGKLKAEDEIQCRELQETIFDILKMIRDPEKTETLGELNVLTEDSIQVQPLEGGNGFQVRIDFIPTVPHCSLASIIGLCLRKKIISFMADDRVKIDIVIAKGKHNTEEEINKQLNDKERVAAAMENPNLNDIVNSCIAEPE